MTAGPPQVFGLGKTSRGDAHLVFNEEVIQARTVKRMVENRRWKSQAVQELDALPWLPRPPRVQERAAARRRRYITWGYIRKYGGTPGCSACSVDSYVHTKACVDRFQAIFVEEDTKAAAVAIAERVSRDNDAAAEAEAQGVAPPVVGSGARSSNQAAPQPAAAAEQQEQQQDIVDPVSMDLERAVNIKVPESPMGVARKAEVDVASPSDVRSFKKVRAEIDAEMMPSPGIRGETRPADPPSPSTVPESKKLREVAGLAVCALRVVGGTLDSDEIPYDEPDVPRRGFDPRCRGRREL